MIPRFARITVTLCLIVATTIQPMGTLAVAETCGDNVCAAQMRCQGCGCCDVEHQGDKCCCCTGESSKEETHDSDIAEPVGSGLAVTGHCTCGVSGHPMNRNQSRESFARELSLRIASLDFVELPTETTTVVRPDVVNATPGSRADFGQRFLCVWRI